LLEGGGIAHHVTERGVYKVVYAPRPALVTDPDLAWRFGGNTNHWFGNCGPLDDADFASRPWVPHSGWPLRRADLVPFYERAEQLCGLVDLRLYDAEAYAPLLRPPPSGLDPSALAYKIVQTCPVPSFDRLYRQRFADAHNLQVLLNARALRLETNPGADVVRAAAAGDADGRRFRVAARALVLAAGGIENPRLLLCSAAG